MIVLKALNHFTSKSLKDHPQKTGINPQNKI